MQVVHINSMNFGSTGKIIRDIEKIGKVYGINVIGCFPKSRENLKNKKETDVIFGSRLLRNFHIMFGRVTGLSGLCSVVDTWMLLRKLNESKPDIIHLHNLHNCYINLPMLFSFLKKNNIGVVWTLHDCWAFTGQCPHFEYVKCKKWRTGCNKCRQYKGYPATIIDQTKTMWKLKKRWFSKLDYVTIVTPSEWLSKLVKQSYLQKYDIRVINNGVDTGIFNAEGPVFDFEGKLARKAGQKILLGVAFGWGERKGLDVFLRLSEQLPEEEYMIILVGTDPEIDKNLPQNIRSINKTYNQEELAKIYRAADVLINPTREDTYPTVNLEAIACGTPVVSFDVGGCAETIPEGCGIISEDGIDMLIENIKKVIEEKETYHHNCVQISGSLDKMSRLYSYIELYSKK